jgi:tetratricopeptide (TPR) repeat protein
MLRVRSIVCLIALLAGGCSNHRSTPATVAPELPKLVGAHLPARIRDAVETAYREVAARPGDAALNGRLGMLLHAFEQYDAAELCYRRATAFDPKRFQWAYYLGLVELINGKNEEASSALRDAVRLDPQYVPAGLKLAEAELILGRLDASERTIQSIVAASPQLAPAYYWSGRVASARGQVSAAMDQYRKACRLWPTYGTAHYALALLCQSAGRTAEGREHMAAYQKYRADGDPQPEDPLLEEVRALDNTALAHLMKGVDLENAGRLPEAIAEHEEAIRQDPKLAQAHANLIALYARSGQPGPAESEYRATVAINPNLPQSHYDYGVFLVGSQRFREAEAAFRKALESSPSYAEAHSNLGAMLERSGKFAEAMQHYRAAIEAKPNFRLARFQLGRLLLVQKKTKEAISELSQTLTPEDGQTPRFLYTLGIAYREAGDLANARQYLKQAADRAASLQQTELAFAIATTQRQLEERAAR